MSCVLFISNFEHYFLQGSLVLNKKLMKKYCKLVSLLSILVWVTECKVWNWKWHSAFAITNPPTVKQIQFHWLSLGDIHSFCLYFFFNVWLYQNVQTNAIAYLLYANNNFFNSKCENLICVYKSTVMRGNMQGDPFPFLWSPSFQLLLFNLAANFWVNVYVFTFYYIGMVISVSVPSFCSNGYYFSFHVVEYFSLLG